MKLSLKKKQEIDFFNFEAIGISLASPEQIREMSYGEVKKTETLNYKTLKPERDGLFCEKIFGPVRDYECSCGKYKKTMAVASDTIKPIVCNRCGVEITSSKVRRERMGHIELAVPVAHFWYFGKVPSKIAIFLDMSHPDVKDIIYGLVWVTVKEIDDIKDLVLQSIQSEIGEQPERCGLSKEHIDVFYYIIKENKEKIPLPKKFLLSSKEKHLSKLASHIIGYLKKFLQNFRKDKNKISTLATKLEVKEDQIINIVDACLQKLISYIESQSNYFFRKVVEDIINDEKYIGNLGDPKNYLKENVSVLTNAEAIYRLLRDEGKEENLKKELEIIKKELKELYKQENISRTLLLFEKYKDVDVYKEDMHIISKIKDILGFSTKQSQQNDLQQEINELKNALISHIEKGISSEILSELSVLFKKYSITIHPSPERSRLINRSKLIENFLTKNIKPEWMVLTVLPVLPPDLRPLVVIEGGKFASSDLNELYRRIIHRNNRLRKFFLTTKEGSSKEGGLAGIPKPVLLNEKRLLQEAVDALIENSAKKHPIMMSAQKRPLKSLTDILKGKKGRFRQNLLGKRIDYSGRSTIAVGPELKLYQCGLPKEMAYELFKPYLIHKVMKKLNVSLKKAKIMVDRKVPEIWDLLEEITKHHVVLLNRAPTLHTPSIQAFEPVLVDGKAILIHPMVCTPYNADFDGDQMGVYVPLTLQALTEAKLLMTSYFSLFSPANGKVLIGPTQDVVLGISYLTAVKDGEKGEGKIFSSAEEAIYAYEQGIINLNSKIKVVGITDLEIKYENGKPDYSITKDPTKWQSYTTVGRLIFNSILPKEISLFNLSLSDEEKKKKNRVFGKNDLVDLIKEIYQKCGAYETIKFLDELKKLGYHYATISGFTISVDDMIIPKGKLEKIKEAQQRIKEVEQQAKEGIITEKERYNSVIDIWSETIDKITKEMIEEMEKVGKEPYREGKPRFNSVYFMAQSGARGNIDQVRQLSAIRGLMSRPQRKIMGEIGEIIETPILSNFREGLTPLEYFISAHGGRKGLTDTALKTSEAGYLTRRLIDVAHHVVITEEDCGTINRIKVSALKVGDEVIESLAERIAGRVAADDITYEVIDEKTNQVVVKVVKAGEMITEEQAKEIEKSGLYESIRIRSVLTCESKRGVCAKCYGMDLSTGKLVEVGKPVGIIAAQSIGEPGTQLTLRTFHIGGAAARLVKQSQIRAPYDGKIEYFSETQQSAKFKTIQKKDATTGRIFWIVLTSDAILRFVYTTPKGEKKRETWRLEYGARIYVRDGQEIKKGELIADWDVYSIPIICEKKGRIKYQDLKENRTYVVEQISSGNLEKRVLPHRGRENPRLDVVNDKGKIIATYPLPADTVILVEDGQEVSEGDVIAKIPKEEIKTKDITGGLPRVEELFEARHPENSAVLAEIDGIIKIETKEDKTTETPKTEVIVKIVNPKATKEVKIPPNRILLVYDGDKVEAGEPLTDGVIDPHKYLEIRGPHHLQEFYLNEIQQVYRLQGVHINDKHIEIIIRQMLSFVRITDPGLPPKPKDNKKFYEFIYGEIVPKRLFEEEVEKINKEKKLLRKEGKHKEAEEICPPKAEPVLLGISTVALWSESFLSAASFQETSRVLAEAAVEGRIDNLTGLKENVIIGRLIPSGTGFYREEGLSLFFTKEPQEKLF